MRRSPAQERKKPASHGGRRFFRCAHTERIRSTSLLGRNDFNAFRAEGEVDPPTIGEIACSVGTFVQSDIRNTGVGSTVQELCEVDRTNGVTAVREVFSFGDGNKATDHTANNARGFAAFVELNREVRAVQFRFFAEECEREAITNGTGEAGVRTLSRDGFCSDGVLNVVEPTIFIRRIANALEAGAIGLGLDHRPLDSRRAFEFTGVRSSVYACGADAREAHRGGELNTCFRQREDDALDEVQLVLTRQRVRRRDVVLNFAVHDRVDLLTSRRGLQVEARLYDSERVAAEHLGNRGDFAGERTVCVAEFAVVAFGAFITGLAGIHNTIATYGEGAVRAASVGSRV